MLRSFLDSLGDARAGKRRVSVFFLRGLFAYDEEGGMCETLWRIFTHKFVPLSRNNRGTYCLFNSNRIFKIFLEDEKIPLSFSRNALQEGRKFCENL